ncbi:MAG: hypothetical protein FJ104_01465 [Deltaproteobacteria bacterium]|nr:hypothetical protein [Deltaproteobacteria bacterium]
MSRLGSSVMGVAAGVAAFVVLEHLERLRSEWSPMATWIGDSWRTIVADPSSLLEAPHGSTSSSPATAASDRGHESAARPSGSIADLGPRVLIVSSPVGAATTRSAAAIEVEASETPRASATGLDEPDLAMMATSANPATSATPAFAAEEASKAMPRASDRAPQPDPDVLSRSADLGAATTRAMELASTMERLGRRLEGRRPGGERR